MMSTPSHNGGGAPEARLMITKMVLENFKSYAGVQEIGPFHKRFSSIVGPNGSGKSNVIDALLFVFGKRAKQLRLNKVSELIHKSSKYPNLDFARVAIHFQLIHDIETSEDDFEVVPGSEFVVTRVATTNNQSKYTVDGKNSTYTEVGLLLRKYGIDLDNNRFLILQGEVEQIAMMKPKAQSPHEDGLLEYLEDIIGSNKYVERINEAQKVVEEFNELRVEKVKRLQLTQNEKDNLEGPRAEAAAYLEKEAELRERLNLLYQLYIQEAAKNVAEIATKKEKSQERLMYERTKLTETETRLSSIEGEYTTTNKEYDALVEEMQRTTEEFTAFERRDTKLIEDMKHIKTQIAKLQTSLNKEIKKEADYHAETDTTQQKINALKESQGITMSRKADAEAHLDTVMDGLREATAALRQDLEVALTELSAADRSVSALQTEKESISTSIELAQSRAQSASKSLMQQEDRLGVLRAEKMTTEKTKVQAEKALAAGQKKAATDAQELAKLRQDEQALQLKIRTAITDLEETRAQSQQSDTVSRAEIAAIMNQTRKGGLLANAGVHGRLGDLGTIGAEYDVAISTACGMLDYIVVDNTEGAQACVAYLREYNVGRASFIVLDKQPDFRAKMDNPPALPPNTPRLFDLVTVKNPIYRPAFYSAVKDTLVSSDLDTAVKIAYVGDRVKWRVVTTDGNLIDTSGAMSGGGKTAKSGGMRPTKEAKTSDAETTKCEMARLESVVAALQGELDACRGAIVQLENQMQTDSQSTKKLTIEVEKCTVTLNQISADLAATTERITALQTETTMTSDEEQKIAQLQKKLNQIDAQMALVSPNRSNIQQQVQSIQQQILDVGGPKLKRAQASMDNLSTELDTITRDLASAEAQHQNSIKQAAKSATAKVKAEKDLEKSLQKKTDLEAEQKEMEKDAEKVLIAQAQAKKAAEEKETFLKTITGEYKSLKELIAKIRNVEVDLTSAVDEFNKAIKENEAKKKHWEDKLEEIRRVHAAEMQEQAKWAPVAQEAVPESKDDDMEIEAPEVGVLEVFTAEELDKHRSYDAIKREINVLEAERDKLKGSVNMTALAEYRKKDVEYRERMSDLEEVTEKRNAARKAHDELRRQRLEDFMSGFGVITLKLKEMYQMITLGGDAELELVDSLDPFSEGIVFSVRPPKKSWKNISNLSGGEKTLSSLALVFALHHYKPTPLYVMDEIDAALDFKNVSIVANYIKERTKNAQFVIISLRNNMFELADRLVGIYKTNDATKSVTINPRAFGAAVEGKRMPGHDENSSRKVNILVDSTNVRA